MSAISVVIFSLCPQSDVTLLHKLQEEETRCQLPPLGRKYSCRPAVDNLAKKEGKEKGKKGEKREVVQAARNNSAGACEARSGNGESVKPCF